MRSIFIFLSFCFSFLIFCLLLFFLFFLNSFFYSSFFMFLWTFKQHSTLLTVYFSTPNMFITLWFGFDYRTNPPLGTLMIQQVHLCVCIWKCYVFNENMDIKDGVTTRSKEQFRILVHVWELEKITPKGGKDRSVTKEHPRGLKCKRPGFMKGEPPSWTWGWHRQNGASGGQST
jgi:hypothetical protein